MCKAWEPISYQFHERLYAVAVEDVRPKTFARRRSPEDVRRVDLRFEHQSLRVHQQMALSSLHLLAGVVATLLPANSGGLHALAVDDAGCRLWVPPEAHPHPPA